MNPCLVNRLNIVEKVALNVKFVSPVNLNLAASYAHLRFVEIDTCLIINKRVVPYLVVKIQSPAKLTVQSLIGDVAYLA